MHYLISTSCWQIERCFGPGLFIQYTGRLNSSQFTKWALDLIHYVAAITFQQNKNKTGIQFHDYFTAIEN